MKKRIFNLRNVLAAATCLAAFSANDAFGQQERTRTTVTKDVEVTSATAVTIEELNPGVRTYPFLCEYEMIPKDNPAAVYEELNTERQVEDIVANAEGWINTYVNVCKSRMMKKYNADAILSATYEAVTGAKGELVITVRGYPVKYTGFRSATKDDLWILDFEKSNANIRTLYDEGVTRATVLSQEEVTGRGIVSPQKR